RDNRIPAKEKLQTISCHSPPDPPLSGIKNVNAPPSGFLRLNLYISLKGILPQIFAQVRPFQDIFHIPAMYGEEQPAAAVSYVSKRFHIFRIPNLIGRDDLRSHG